MVLIANNCRTEFQSGIFYFPAISVSWFVRMVNTKKRPQRNQPTIKEETLRAFSRLSTILLEVAHDNYPFEPYVPDDNKYKHVSKKQAPWTEPTTRIKNERRNRYQLSRYENLKMDIHTSIGGRYVYDLAKKARQTGMLLTEH